MDQEQVSIGEAAAILGLSAERTRGLANQGVLPIAGRTRNGRVFRRREVEAVAARRRADVEALAEHRRGATIRTAAARDA